MPIDPTYFADVADALGISDPSLIEKDYYATQLLRIVSAISTLGHSLIFAGGTCLAKAHIKTYRMSEDIDIKAIPNKNTAKETRSAQRRIRKSIRTELEKLLKESKEFNLIDGPIIRDGYRHQHYQIGYPATFDPISALRPNLQLEITEATLYQETTTAEISSLLFEIAGIGSNPLELECVAIETTAAEKFVSLLRRTAAVARNPERKDDPTLIRHIYDLHLIAKAGMNFDQVATLIQTVIEQDVGQFGNQHPEFKSSPCKELKFGLSLISAESVFERRYNEFLGPLVYHPNPPTWGEVLSSLDKLASKSL